MVQDLLNTISDGKDAPFDEVSNSLIHSVASYSRQEFLKTLGEIGTIPEQIPHDSTEEKLYSKITDAVLSRCFQELGLQSMVLKERGDAADVIARSPLYGYALAADAKAFRMSRTAKNQKDFKVTALSMWKKDAEYAILCAPYFQYPSKASQIYAQSLEHNVCLLSWEHMIFLLENDVREDETHSLAKLWGFPESYAHSVIYADRKNCFLDVFHRRMTELFQLDWDSFQNSLRLRVGETVRRGEQEIAFWEMEIQKIEQYGREQAIQELIEAKKIRQKITQIRSWIRRLPT